MPSREKPILFALFLPLVALIFASCGGGGGVAYTSRTPKVVVGSSSSVYPDITPVAVVRGSVSSDISQLATSDDADWNDWFRRTYPKCAKSRPAQRNDCVSNVYKHRLNDRDYFDARDARNRGGYRGVANDRDRRDYRDNDRDRGRDRRDYRRPASNRDNRDNRDRRDYRRPNSRRDDRDYRRSSPNRDNRDRRDYRRPSPNRDNRDLRRPSPNRDAKRKTPPRPRRDDRDDDDDDQRRDRERRNDGRGRR